jgi:hypothetical protein
MLTPIYIQNDSSNDSSDKKKSKPKKRKQKKRKQKTKPQITDSLDTDSLQLLKDSILIDSLLHDSLLALNIDSISNSTAIFDSIYSDSLIGNLKDTLQYTTLNIEPPANDNNIHIAKDELIYALYVLPQGKKSDFLCNTHNKRDSLLANNIKSSGDDGLYVEFWHSPVNYSGYKLSNNTLVLFGVYEYTSIRLKYLPEGLLRLNYHYKTYDLKCTDQFIPLLINK